MLIRAHRGIFARMILTTFICLVNVICLLSQCFRALTKFECEYLFKEGEKRKNKCRMRKKDATYKNMKTYVLNFKQILLVFFFAFSLLRVVSVARVTCTKVTRMKRPCEKSPSILFFTENKGCAIDASCVRWSSVTNEHVRVMNASMDGHRVMWAKNRTKLYIVTLNLFVCVWVGASTNTHLGKNNRTLVMRHLRASSKTRGNKIVMLND